VRRTLAEATTFNCGKSCNSCSTTRLISKSPKLTPPGPRWVYEIKSKIAAVALRGQSDSHIRQGIGKFRNIIQTAGILVE